MNLQVAYPKTHQREWVPWLYRFAAERKGIFVNIASVSERSKAV